VTGQESFREKVERFQAEAPDRAAARADRSAPRKAGDALAGLGARLLLVLLVLAAVGLLVLAVVALAGVWRILFAILVVVVAGVAWVQIRGR